jgi:hypothetical protein
MEDENKGVEGAEVSAAVSPAENNTEEEKTVPYSRFQEVLKERNSYRELVSAKAQKPEEPEAAPEAGVEEALRIVDGRIKSRLDELKSELELKETAARFPDFYRFADEIKELVKETPGLSWDTAYKAAKVESVGAEAARAGAAAAERKQAEKRAAAVEAAAVNRPAVRETEGVDPMAKGPDGKFLYTTSELESILPKS